MPGFMFSCAVTAEQTPSCTVFVQPGESIQAAIDAAPVGAVVCLGAGEWEEHLAIGKTLTLRGEAADTTTIRGYQESVPVIRLHAQGGQAVVVGLFGLTVTGGMQQYGPGLIVEDSAQAVITDCTVSKNASGIELHDSSQATIEGCRVVESRGWLSQGSSCYPEIDLYFERAPEMISSPFMPDSWSAPCGVGVMVGDRAQAKITGCVVSRNEEDGIVLLGDARAAIQGCAVSENTSCGISLSESAEVTVEDCAVSGNGYGIELAGAAQAVIRRNVIHDNRLCGVSSWSSDQARGEENAMVENGVDLVGNLTDTLRLPLAEATEQEVSYPGPRFPSLQHAVDALVPGGRLTIRDGEYLGGVTIGKRLAIVAASGTEPILTTGSHQRSNGVVSVVGGAELFLQGLALVGGWCGLIAGGDAQAVIVGCGMSGNSFGLLAGSSARVTITDTTVQQTENAIVLWDAARATITGCQVSESAGNGLVLGGNAQADVELSSISGSERNGIVLAGNTRIALANSTISMSGSYGLALEDDAQATITGSAVFGNRSEGIILWDYAQATISDSSVSENGSGVEALDSAQSTLDGCSVSRNTEHGIWLRGSSRARITSCAVSGSGEVGILIGDRAEAELWDSTILNNMRGVCLFVSPWFDAYHGFSGRVTGGRNKISGPDDLDANQLGAVFPGDLGFLVTGEGSELDWRYTP
jgi:parallel beta-helix repeat protein